MTALEKIQTLEEPYRSQIIENANIDLTNSYNGSISDTLGYLFIWAKSPQGLKYWQKYEQYLIKKGL